MRGINSERPEKARKEIKKKFSLLLFKVNFPVVSESRNFLRINNVMKNIGIRKWKEILRMKKTEEFQKGMEIIVVQKRYLRFNANMMNPSGIKRYPITEISNELTTITPCLS
jgi:hypothetical protein